MSTPERLIKATQELLWERGYGGTSPRAIQQRADAGQGSMYHHFAGKPDLALTAVRRTAEQLREATGQLLDGPGPARDRIAAYLLRERDVLRGCPVGRLTMDPEVIADAELRGAVEETLDWLRERLATLVREGLDAGEFRPGIVPSEIAATIVAAVQGGYVLARASGSPAAFDTAVRGLLSLIDARTP